MEKLVRGSPLPEVYQVQCPYPVPKDWKKLVEKATGRGDSNGSDRQLWYKLQKGSYQYHPSCNSSEKWSDIPEISYEDWKAAILGEQSTVYAVGDYVCIRADSMIGVEKPWEASKAYKITKKSDKCAQELDGKHCIIDLNRLRLATPAEIAASTQVSTDDYRIEKIKGEKVVIQCSTQKEWDTIRAAIPYCRILSTHWEVYDEESCIEYCKNAGTYGDVTYYKNAGYTIVPASRYIAHNSKENEYKVGDWIWAHSGTYISKGKAQQIVDIKGTELHIGNLGWWEKHNCRLATQQEIDQAQGKVQDGWKVGMKLPEKWLEGKQTYLDTRKKHVMWSKENSYNRSIKKVAADGYAQISDTCTIWLSPDQYQSYKSYMETSKSTSEWKIGDKFQTEGVGEIYILARIDGDNVTVEWNDGRSNLDYSKPVVDNYIQKGTWKLCQPVPTEKKTMDDWKGTRVRILPGKGCYDGIYDNTYGTINSISSNRLWLIKLDKDGKVYSFYTPESSTPECEIVNESKQVNNQSITNQKPKTTNNGNSKQQEQQDSSTGTAVNLSANSSTVCRSDRRTATAVRCTGQPILTVRGHRGNPKGLRLS